MWTLQPLESSPGPQMCHSLEGGAQTISSLTLIWEEPLALAFRTMRTGSSGLERETEPRPDTQLTSVSQWRDPKRRPRTKSLRGLKGMQCLAPDRASGAPQRTSISAHSLF